MKYKKVVIGIDQSYQNTGISIAADGKLLKVTNKEFKGTLANSEKRKQLAKVLINILNKVPQRATECIIICERIRTFSGGFISTDYIKAMGALIATIVDTAHDYGVEVYSVDTRCWKSTIVGTSKGIKVKVPDKKKGGYKYVEDKKLPAIKFINGLGFHPVKGNGEPDDDACDSACMALYGFSPKEAQKLKLEK